MLNYAGTNWSKVRKKRGIGFVSGEKVVHGAKTLRFFAKTGLEVEYVSACITDQLPRVGSILLCGRPGIFFKVESDLS